MQKKEFVRNHPQLALFLNAHKFSFINSRESPWSVTNGKGELEVEAPSHSSMNRKIFFLGRSMKNRDRLDFESNLRLQLQSHNDSGEGFEVSQYGAKDILVDDHEFTRLMLELRPRER